MIKQVLTKAVGTAYVAARLRSERRVPYLPLEEVRRRRDANIQRLVRYAAATVPHYRELFRRAVQKAQDHLAIDLVAPSGLPDHERAALEREVRDQLGEPIRLDLRVVDTIESRGIKTRAFQSELSEADEPRKASRCATEAASARGPAPTAAAWMTLGASLPRSWDGEIADAGRGLAEDMELTRLRGRVRARGSEDLRPG